jgi:F-type H+-transporting ATPase subunit delta
MGPTIIARNYAETLLALAQRHGGDEAVDEYGDAIGEVAELLEREPLVREFLETPRVDLAGKKRALQASFGGRVPDLFLRFLMVVVAKRRQTLLREIAEQYRFLVDDARGRARAEIVLALEPDEALRAEIVSGLERRLDKQVVPTFHVDPSLLGGILVRVGGQTMDGSLRRRAVGLRRRLLEVEVPGPNGGATVGEF